MREQRGGTVTFVFTDIEGSTRLVQQFKDRWPEVRSAHRRIVRQAFETQGGDEVDTQGDSFFYVFGRARDAALAAADATRGLAGHEWPEDGEVRIRIGMHTGEPVVSEEGYHGIGVHRAARIMSAGHGGQVLLSEATAAVLRDEEVPGIGVKDLGVHRLKDLDRPEHVYQLVADGLEPAFSKIRTAGEAKPYYRRPLVIGATAGVLAAAVAIPVFALAGGSGTTSLEAVDDNSVGVVDESSSQLFTQATGVDEPRSAAAGANAIWVTSGGGSVAEIDPQTHQVKQTIDVGDGPEGVAVSGQDVWVANSLDNTVSRVSAATNPPSVTDTIDVGNSPTGVAVGRDSVWVANAGDGTVTRLNALSGKVIDTIDVDAPVRGIAYGKGSLWVTNPAGNAVIRVPVNSPSSSTTIGVGSGPSEIAYGNGKVWVANNLAGTVSRIDPTLNAMTGMFPVGAAPSGIAVTAGGVWVSDEVEGTLKRLDQEGRVTKQVHLGGRPEGLAVGNGSVWVGVQAGGESHRGGTLRVLTPVFDYLDPPMAYYPGTWGVVAVTGDGLVGFKRVGGVDGNTLVPDLAETLPTPTDDGRAYTFQLRRGIRFSNGKEVRPADVRASFERMYRAYGLTLPEKDEHGKLLKPEREDASAIAAGYYAGIVGAAACAKHPRTCDLSRGIATSDADRTVTFHLEKPDSEFLYKLAIPFAAIVPKGTPVGGTQRIPGTGPYKVAAFSPHRYARLVRNPYFHVWRRDAQPPGLPDTIEFGVNLEKGTGEPLSAADAFRATVAGRADFAGAGVPPNLLPTARTRYPAQLHVTPAAGVLWVLVNTHKRPFNNVHARRALAFALDRARMAAIRGGPDQSEPTCQILPPGLSGYRPYCPYTAGGDTTRWTAPDLGRAQEEIRRSGTRGAAVRVITTKEIPGVDAQNEVIAATLRRLGYRVTMKAFAKDHGYFTETFHHAQRVDAVANGWFQDYPAPSGFFGGINCPTSPYMCSKAYRSDLARTSAAATATGSNDPWTAFDRRVTDGAYVIPYVTPKVIDFSSKRVGDYQNHPEYGVLMDQLWVR
ncbi:MAG TPA: ABC transporter substrate-binding protein [Gaiellaceae bacterium]|nr:ABC transporter substrate-binding protein [Gaiellaceae bacterium]